MSARELSMEHGASPTSTKKPVRDPSNGDLRIVLDRVESVGERNDNSIADLTRAIRDQGASIGKSLERVTAMVLVAFGIASVALCTLAGYSMYVGLPGLLQAHGQ